LLPSITLMCTVLETVRETDSRDFIQLKYFSRLIVTDKLVDLLIVHEAPV